MWLADLQRTTLSRLVKLMFGLLMLAFIFVLWRFAGGTAQINGVNNSFAPLLIGQTKLQRQQGKRLWVTRLSDAQRQQSLQIAPYLLNPEAGCNRDSEICAVVAATGRVGVEIRHIQDRPPQLPNKAAWFGGFVDPASGAVYDLLGRAYWLPDMVPDSEALTVFMFD